MPTGFHQYDSAEPGSPLGQNPHPVLSSSKDEETWTEPMCNLVATEVTEESKNGATKPDSSASGLKRAVEREMLDLPEERVLWTLSSLGGGARGLTELQDTP